MEVSKLNFYSVGTVAENKALDSPYVEVVALEDTPFVDGELTSNATKFKSSGVDAEGSAYNHEVDTAVTVRACWLPFGQSNRVTPPDVQRGETVILFRFGDTDEYWWTTLRNDAKLRRLETVIFGIKATANLDEEPNADNMYWIELSSHQKLIHLHTSKANGEYCAFDIQINTGDGCIVFKDDQGMQFNFDTKNHRIEFFNQDGSHVDMNKTEITFTSTDKVTVQTKVFEVNAETINENSSTQNITSDTVNSTATWKHTGTLASSGQISTTASVKSSGDVTAGNISVMKHTHKDGDSKEGNVGPPQ